MPNTTLQYWLWEVAKVDPKDVTIVSMGIDATQQAVLAGAVEGGTLREPAVSIVTGRNPAIRLMALGGEMFPNQPGTVVAVTRALLDKEPDAVQAIVTGIVRAVDLIGREPDRGRADHRGRARQGPRRHRHHPPGARLPGDALHRRSAPDRRADGGDAALPGQDRRARPRGAPRRAVRAALLRARGRGQVKNAHAIPPRGGPAPALGLAAFFALWEAVPRLGLVNPAFLPPPSVLPEAFLRELRSGQWLAAVTGSLGHYLAGLALGVGLGIAAGTLTGMSRTAEG